MTRVVAGLLALAAVFAPRIAHALPTHTWVVVAGNNRGAAGEVALLYAERDAQELASVLRQQGGVSSRRTTVLLDEDADTLRRTLQDVNAEIRNKSAAGIPSALVVFYSGHADAEGLHLHGTVLAMEELKALVEGSPAAMRLLIVDACRSGTVTRVKGVAPAETFPIQVEQQAVAEGLAIITSSAAGETSQESDRLRGSFFTHHLVNALRGAADDDGDGRVTLAEAYGYTYGRTLRSSGQTLALQHPTYAFDVKGRGDVVLSEPSSGDDRLARLRLSGPGTYLLSERDESGPVVAEVSPEKPRTLLAVAAGEYFVQERQAREFREYKVALEAGREVNLDDVPFRTFRYDQLVRRRGAPEATSQGLTLLVGGQGPLLAGENPSLQGTLGWGVDFPWATIGLRARASTTASAGADGQLVRRHEAYGGAITLQRFVDLEPVSVAFGLSLEGAWHRQVFDPTRLASDRNSFGVAFGGLFSVERPLDAGFSLRLEGGPVATLLPAATFDGVRETGWTFQSPLTWWLSGGLTWRL